MNMISMYVCMYVCMYARMYVYFVVEIDKKNLALMAGFDTI